MFSVFDENQNSKVKMQTTAEGRSDALESVHAQHQLRRVPTRSIALGSRSCDRGPAEEGRNIATVAEEVHDVAEVICVLEAEGVPELVHAREVDDCVSEQWIASRRSGEVWARAFVSGRTYTAAPRRPLTISGRISP